MGKNRKKILFVVEAATLAHVARSSVLARALDPNYYQVFFACDPSYSWVLGDATFQRLMLRSQSTEEFLKRISQGQPLFDSRTLRTYVKQELALIQEIKPDLVVGDLRFSLSAAARLTRTPFATITNAYWSRYAQVPYPAPDIPILRGLGAFLGNAAFQKIRPLAFAYHAWPLNRVRKEVGLKSLRWDMRESYTEADYTLYAETPNFIPMSKLPPNHIFLGPIVWSPPASLPSWWDAVPTDKPIIYLSLGSSGRVDSLLRTLHVLKRMLVSVLVATAGRLKPDHIPSQVFHADYLPGSLCAEKASLVICNGGSPATSQALAKGTPVLGITSHMDQDLNMQAAQRQGAGLCLRAGELTDQKLWEMVAKILQNSSYQNAAARLAKEFASYDPSERFGQFVDGLLGRPAEKNVGKDRLTTFQEKDAQHTPEVTNGRTV